MVLGAPDKLSGDVFPVLIIVNVACLTRLHNIRGSHQCELRPSAYVNGADELHGPACLAYATGDGQFSCKAQLNALERHPATYWLRVCFAPNRGSGTFLPFA